MTFRLPHALRRRRGAHRARRVAALSLALAPLTGCDSFDELLAIETPSRLPSSELERPENAPLMVNGTDVDLACALGSFIVAGGLVAGELVDGTQTAARWDYDRRTVQPQQATYSTSSCESLGVYTPVSTARYTADTAARKLAAWTDEQVPNRQLLLARAANNAGYSLVLLGEAFCTAAIAGGPEVERAAIFTEAEARFTTALAAAQAAGNVAQTNLAYAGRARARRNLNRMTDAVADARMVPAGFVFNVQMAELPSRRANRVVSQNVGGSVNIAPAYRDVTWQGVADPRTALEASGRNTPDQRPLFLQTKYDTISSPLVLASYTEAQLIIAEGVGGGEAVQIIGALHAAAGIPGFASADETEIQRQVIEERRRELFLEGHRLFDTWRYGDAASPYFQALLPAPGTAYPKGGLYADQRCMPLPDVERFNNPNIPDAAG